MRHLFPEIWNAGVVVPSFPLQLLTVVHQSSSAGASDTGVSAGCCVSVVAGGFVLGWATGTAGVVKLQAVIEPAAKRASPA